MTELYAGLSVILDMAQLAALVMLWRQARVHDLKHGFAQDR